MGTRPRKKQQHRLDRWQVLAAAVAAAVASIAVALINLIPSGSPPAPSVDITDLAQQPYPPPPGQLYLWTGTVHDQPASAEVFVSTSAPANGSCHQQPSSQVTAGP